MARKPDDVNWRSQLSKHVEGTEANLRSVRAKDSASAAPQSRYQRPLSTVSRKRQIQIKLYGLDTIDAAPSRLPCVYLQGSTRPKPALTDTYGHATTELSSLLAAVQVRLDSRHGPMNTPCT